MIHSGLYQVRNEEFPALTKSQPISFGNNARILRHSSPGDHNIPSHDCSRKKRVKKKRKHLRVDGDCHVDSEVSVNRVTEAQHLSSTEKNTSEPCSDKPGSCPLKQALVRDLDSVHAIRTTDDEGFVDGVTDSIPTNVTASLVMVAGSNNEKTSTLVQKHAINCLEAVPMLNKSTASSVPCSSVSTSCSSSSTSTPPPPSDNEDKIGSTVPFFDDRVLCARCEDKCGDAPLFESMELPHLWDSVSSRTDCCRRLPGGDEANTTDRTRPGSVSDIGRDSGKAKTLSGTGDYLDEDDMEGTDLLHLISNSLDRFNAIVHPHDLSGLTSGLGASEALLSDLDWSVPESGSAYGLFKCGKEEASGEQFTDNHFSWLKSRLTASSCPNSSSMTSRVTASEPFPAGLSDRVDLVTPPVPMISESIPSASSQCRSPCIDDLGLCTGESASRTSHTRPTSLSLDPLDSSVAQPQYSHNDLAPGGMSRGHSLAASPFESDSVYSGAQSLVGRPPHSQSTHHAPNTSLDPGALISASNQTGTTTTAGFTFPLTTADPVTPWTSGEIQTSTNLRLPHAQTLLDRPMANPIASTTTAANGFVSQLDHSYPLPDSVTRTGRLNWDTLSHGLDWLSLQGTSGLNRAGGLLSPSLGSTDQAGRGLTTRPGPLAPPGLAVCSNGQLGFDSVSGLDGSLDSTLLLSRNTFATVQRPGTVGPTSPPSQPQPQIPVSMVAAHTSQSGKSVLSTCLSSDFNWDVKGLDMWNGLYPACDRRTRPATTGPGLIRSRLPHSDSAVFVGSDFGLGSRRASMSAGVPFDLPDLVQPGPQPMRFDSPDPLGTSTYSGPNAVRSMVVGRSAPGLTEPSKRPVVTAAGATAPTYPLLQPTEANHHTTAGHVTRFVAGGTANTTMPGPQPRQANWSTGWSIKSPTLRTMNAEHSVQNHRHGNVHKRLNHAGMHPFARTGSDRSADGPVFSANMTNRGSATRGGSPCTQAFQPVVRATHAYHSMSKIAPSCVSSSSSSSPCASLTASSNSRPLSNGIETATESTGRPVVAKWRRACSFYLRGHCKKEDCEFAHDLTKVTCKFWEMGECFKGPTCPFLHGYPPELTEA